MLGILIHSGRHFLAHTAECLFVIILRRIFALKNIDVEISKLRSVEIKIRSAVGIWIFEIGPRPVKHRHEVITYGLYSGFAEVSKTLLIILYQLIAVRTSVFDRLAHRKTLHHRPAQTMLFDEVFHFYNFLFAPYLSVGYMMKCRNYPLHTDLTQHVEGYLIVGSEPTPRFFHISPNS